MGVYERKCLGMWDNKNLYVGDQIFYKHDKAILFGYIIDMLFGKICIANQRTRSGQTVIRYINPSQITTIEPFENLTLKEQNIIVKLLDLKLKTNQYAGTTLDVENNLPLLIYSSHANLFYELMPPNNTLSILSYLLCQSSAP